MKKLTLLFILAVSTLSLLACSATTIEKVDVYEMESFSAVKEDSLTSYTDPEVVRVFVNAFKEAKKESGVVDMPDPEYKVEFGGKSYYLWIREEQGTIMHTTETHTIYSLSQSSAKRIYELLNE